jgi:hypothetical protein
MQGLDGIPGGDGFYWREVGVRDCSSPSDEEGDEDRHTAKRTFKVNWDERFTARNRILGFSTRQIGGTAFINRWLPEYHPEATDMVAVHVHTRPVAWRSRKIVSTVDGPKKISKFQYALIDVTYESVKYNVLGNSEVNHEWERNLIYEARESAEYQSVPAGNLFWPNGNTSQPIPVGAGKIVSFREMTWTWKQVPWEGLNRVLLRDSQGKVNKTVFVGPPWVANDDGTQVLGESYAAGTLLLLSAQPAIKFQPDGRVCWDCILTVRYDRTQHNRLYDWVAGSFRTPSRDGVQYNPGSVPDGKCIFDETEFAAFFDIV